MEDFNSKYTGRQVEDLLDQVASGNAGEDGATFTPSVDAAGNLSWTNNKGLTNPPTVNIKGPKGDAVEGAATEEYVNNAIANAITNVINASY